MTPAQLFASLSAEDKMKILNVLRSLVKKEGA
ncbi:hypothetical protein C7374_11183 [Falsochrobactrum ovis]|uniref:Uncharacterized protein n=1 Tax=Falsochrobactrum ovis TaxID=1293442 RepID=A0A364JTY1_9HYPH|nr:hypothetical protein C7374_11183 [Falsochrobactrum ovis]